MPGNEMTSSEQVESRPRRSLAARILSSLLPLAVLAGAVVVALWLMQTGPKAKPRPKERNAALVEIQPVSFGPQQTTLSAMGTVKAAREVELRPQVSGEIVDLSAELVPGGTFTKGERLLRIDPVDYRLAVRQLATDVAKAESELKIEQGNQLVARREYELLGEPVSAEEKALMLRQPQLDSLRASLEASRARLEQARLDLQRTEIKAPFNAVVQSRQVNLGARVNESTALVSLIDSDEYWVEVSVPVSQLRWIEIPRSDSQAGSLVRIYDQAAWGEGVFRKGRVIRLAADLEAEGRMARLLVSVKDPLGLSGDNAPAPSLLIGSFVRVQIEGRKLRSAAVIDRNLLRDGDNLWLMDEQGRLEIRPVEIAFKGHTQVLVSDGLAPGEQLVVSDLSTPVAGMALRLQGHGQQASSGTEGVAARSEAKRESNP